MTNLSENPWLNMPESTQRRADNNSAHDLFWITDLLGDYGFCLKSKNKFIITENQLSLKGISVLKRNSNAGIGEFFLVINDKEDWPIFLKLCRDLIAVTQKHETDEGMINAVELRLKRWQQLLKQHSRQNMTLEQQMGLFSELSCLRDVVVPKTGIKQAVISWVGPDADKQDFLIDNAVLEIKSHRTSAGPVIQISSLRQLYSEKEPLFLFSYALTRSENGQSVEDVLKSMVNELDQMPVEVNSLFESKLAEYGYIPELFNEPLCKFIIDKLTGFRVTDGFPKIRPVDVSDKIKNVKYSIDLSQCHEYEVEISSIFNKKGDK